MRPYIPAIVVVVVFVALLGAGLLTSSVFQSPQTTYPSDADQKIEQAQRMLQQYEGGHPRLMLAIEALEKMPPASQPASEPTPAAPSEQQDMAAQSAQHAEQGRQQLKDRFTKLGGPAGEGTGGITSREELRKTVSENADLLDKALKLVQEVTTSSSEGTDAIRGDSLAVATRLEAILLYHQADLKRRQAAVQQSVAHAEQEDLAGVLASWRQAHRTVGSLQMELAGTKGGTITLTSVKQAGTESAPSGDKPPKKPAAAAGKKPTKSKGAISKFFNNLMSGPKPADDTTAPEPVAPEPQPDNTAPPADTSAPSQPVAAESAPPAGPIAIGDVPPLADRIKQLETQGTKVDGEIAEAQKDVDQLTAQVQGLRDRFNKAKAEAEAAEKRMMELSDTGVTTPEPNSLKRFTDEYNQAAKKNRESSREAAALESGVIRNAKPDTDDDMETATAPLVPSENGKELAPEVGIIHLEADLRAAQSLVETRQKLRKLIGGQVSELKKLQQQVQDRLAKAKEWEGKLLKEASAITQRATAAANLAQKYEEEALSILSGPGAAAAQRAASAAQTQASSITTFYQHNVPTVPSPQVGFLSGHAQTLAGDMEFGQAVVYTQRASVLTSHQHLLKDVQALGLDPASLLKGAEGSGGDNSAGTPTTQPEGIVQAIQEARANAVKLATAAMESYAKADNSLGRLWITHTQIAAVHYLLASLTTGEDAQKHVAEALHEYKVATADRADRPEAKAFRPVVEALTQAQQQPQQ